MKFNRTFDGVGVPAILLMAILLASCDLQDKKMTNQNLDNEIVRIELDSESLNIPTSYMYGEAIEKRKMWPKPKHDRLKVKAVSFSVLLPDLRPYRLEDDARWKILGHGDRIEATLSIRQGWTQAWISTLYAQTQQEVNEGRSVQQTDIHGLKHYITPAGTHAYFPAATDPLLLIDCDRLDRGLASPGCHVRSVVRPGLELSYDFGYSHLPEWHRIDVELKALVKAFGINK